MKKHKVFRGATLQQVLVAVAAECGDKATIIKTEHVSAKRTEENKAMVEVTVALDGKSTEITSHRGHGIELGKRDYVVYGGSLPSPSALSKINSTPEQTTEAVFQKLEQLGLDSDISGKIAALCRENLSPSVLRDRKSLVRFVNYMLLQSLSAYDAAPIYQARVCAFVGPSGYGKSTTIAKLASNLYINGEQHVAVIVPTKNDNYVLQTLCEKLDFPCFEAKHRDQIQALVERLAEDYVVFIDTPSLPLQRSALRKLAQYLPQMREIEVNLVLNLAHNESSLYQTIRIFRECSYHKLVFTNLDAVSEYGKAINSVLIANTAVSYLASGEGLPGVVERYSKEKLVAMLNLN